MAIDPATAQAHLDQWLAADLAVAGNQSYTIGDRQLTRANAAEIRSNIDYWSAQLSRANKRAAGRGGIRFSSVVIR